MFVYGFAGWLADRWLGTSFLVAVGIIVGAVLGLYLTWNRFNRPSAGDGDTNSAGTGDAVSFTGTTVIRAEGFTPPVPASFDLPPIGPDKTFEMFGQTFYLGVTKPMLQLVLASVLVFVLFYVASRKRAMVPGPDAVRRRGRLLLRAQRHRPRHHRQPGLHALRPATCSRCSSSSC